MDNNQNSSFASQLVSICAEMGNLELGFIFLDKFLKETSMVPHIHAWHEVHVIYSGYYKVFTDDRDYLLEENDICIIPASLNHCVELISTNAKNFNSLISFSRRKTENKKCDEYEYYNSFYQSVNEIKIIKGSEIVNKYLVDFLDIYKSGGIEGIHILKCKLTLAFIEITQKLMEQNLLVGLEDSKKNKQKINHGSANVRFVEIERYIGRNYKKNITLGDLAQHIHLSEAQTARIIKNHLGISFSKLVMQMKMVFAKNNILNSGIPLADLAEEMGYDTYHGFYTAFKRYFGMSPQALRHQSKREN